MCTSTIKKLALYTLTCISLASVSVGALAATTDSSDAELSITKGEAVKISGIDDWLIGVFTATSSINNLQYQWDYECVYSSSGAYRVEIISTLGDNPLNLQSSAGDKMNYEIWSFYRQGNSYNLDGPYTTPTFTLSNLSASQSLSCSDEAYGGNNLFFAAVVRPGPFNNAPPGIYNDQVTLIVSPE